MPFAVKRVIILAAGRGARLAPLTDQTPKPLLVFNQKPIIENVIERLLARLVVPITVVVGYRAEQFAYLSDKYRKVSLLYNDLWQKGNNIFSVHAARDICENALIVNGDTIVTSDVFSPSYERTVMYADRSHGPSKEWELKLDKRGFVKEINTSGGRDILQHREATFVCAKDFEQFKSELERRVADPRHWEDYFEFCFFPWCEVGVHLVPDGSIFDLDHYRDWIEHPLTAKQP